MIRREGSFWDHLNELVLRLKRSLIAIAVGTVGIAVVPASLEPPSNPGLSGLPYEPLLSIILQRVQNDLLPPDVCSGCLFAGPFDLITVYFLGALVVGSILVSPYVALQIYRFVAPALYAREKRAAFWFIGPFLLLLLIGAAFSYFVVLPFAYRFLFGLIPEGSIQPFFPITEFYSVTVLMLLGIGLVFTFPVFTSLLIKLRVFSASDLAKRWREVILGLLVFSAVITPDGTGITMAMLLVPLVALFGIAILAGRIIGRTSKLSTASP